MAARGDFTGRRRMDLGPPGALTYRDGDELHRGHYRPQRSPQRDVRVRHSGPPIISGGPVALAAWKKACGNAYLDGARAGVGWAPTVPDPAVDDATIKPPAR